ncbi:MAG: NEW3 domain-containing protein [Coriobacteriia bacterium]|nr:NEW3 domain-containing protein [Coriobacteriia bacterium]
MNDWAGVLADADNAISDTIIPNDPDPVGQGDRDIDIVAATWDADNLYLYWRRTSSGQRAIVVYAYVDLNGDKRMQATDIVVIMTFANSGYQSNANSSNVVYYNPVNPAGDPMLGDGHTMPGSVRTDTRRVPGASFLGARDASGLQFEGRVDWASLGAPAGSPVSIHFASGNGTSAPGQIEDNVGNPGVLSLAYAGIAISPASQSAGATAGSTATYTYTVTNSGNVSRTYALSATSSAGWTTRALVGGSPATSVTLAPGQSVQVTVQIDVPAGASQGTVDTTTLRATSTLEPGVTSSATARTTVGAISATPDRSGSMHPGGFITYTHTIANNTGSANTLQLTAASSAGWTTQIFAADGVTSISSLTLANGASADVVVRLSVPSGAALGAQDVTSLRAQLAGDPAVFSVARDTTTVRPELTLEPNRQSVGGAGTAVSYPHTIRNSSAATRTFQLSATSSRGWPVRFFAADGVTEITSVTLGPFGASTQIHARVYIPVTADVTHIDVTIVTATFGTLTASVTDTTSVRYLATYDGPGYGTIDTSFIPGQTVYARGTGLSGYSQVRFRWINPSGTLVYTSPNVTVDTLNMANTFYALAPTAPTGEWTLVLVNASNNAEISRTNFTVNHDAGITALSATDAPGVAQSVGVTSSVTNRGSQPITGSTMTYVIWWDSDGNGVFGAGDLYIGADGQSYIYDGSSAVNTHVTNGINVAGGGTWSEPAPWQINNAGFPNQGTYRVSATWTTASGMVIDERVTEFYSIPAMGWPLFALALAAGLAFMWRRGDLATALARITHAEEGRR